MKSSNDARPDKSEHLAGVVVQRIAFALLLAPTAIAQSVPASITTIAQPGADHPIFDASGNTYHLSGPSTPGAAQTQYGGGTCSIPAFHGGQIPGPCPDAAVSKFDPSGNQIWGTLLGGPTADSGTAIAVDANGNVVLTGSTGGQFPTTPGAAIKSSSNATVFAAKISADGSKFVYATYLPDSVVASTAIAVDALGDAYIAGKTSLGHAFVLKLSPDGSAINYIVTLAGSGTDEATAITVDEAGNALVAGETTSAEFPVTAGAFQQNLKGTRNAFLVRLDPAGNVLSSTYFGGSGSDSPSSIAVDVAGNIDLAGLTSSLDLQTTQGPMQPSPIVPAWNNSSPAGFLAQFAPNGTSLHWASYVMSSDLRYLGTTPDVGVSALAVGPSGDIYIGGLTGPGFPVTPSAPLVCFQGAGNRANAFLAHLNSDGALLDATYIGNNDGGDVSFVGGLMPVTNGAVLIAWRATPVGAVSRVQFGSGGWTAPACLSSDVLNSATLSGTNGIAPGELITLTGLGLGPDTGAVYQPDAQGNVPTQLAGVQVRFDGVPVPILYAQSRQINAIAPAGLAASGVVNVTVSYQDQQFGPAVAQVVFGNPGVFRLQIGQSSQAAAINQDGTLNGPTNPAPRGSVVSVWGTGYGQTNPPCPSGGLNVPRAEPLSPGVSALIRKVFVNDPFQDVLQGISDVPVQYAGSAPTLLCGVEQINFQVPLDAAPGTFFFVPGIQFADQNTISGYQPPLGATIVVK